jgi:transcriptional regulator with XRE-family HTH domain
MSSQASIPRHDLNKPNYNAVGRSIKVDPGHVYRVLNGQRAPSVVVLCRMAKTFGVSTDRLVAHIESRRATAAA